MKLPKNGLTTTNAVGPDMNRRFQTLLTTLIVLTITAIVVVGFVLAWDIFDFKGKLDQLFNWNPYAVEEPLCRSDTVVELTCTNGDSLPEGERRAIEEYFTCYYASLGSFYHENISRFFAFQAVDEHIDNLALDFEIEAAKNALVDYSFDSCKIFLYIMSRSRNDYGEMEITVRVSSEMQYGFSSAVTENSGEIHTFVMTEEDKNTVISSHSTDRTARKYAEYAFEVAAASDGFTREDLSYTYYYDYVAKATELLRQSRESFGESVNSALSAEFRPTFEAEYAYDSENACVYAVTSSGHSQTYGTYDENDTNFCSQCVAAGGIPMDDQGNSLTQWKWYDYEINNTRTKEGCTLTWYNRNKFWVYALENTGFGMVAQCSETVRKGDVVQIMKQDEPVLQCIVTDVVYDNDGNPVDFIVCTDKLKNKPVSLLWNGDLRFINIIGYNTANI